MFLKWKSFSDKFAKVYKPLKVFNLHFAATRVNILMLQKENFCLDLC